VGITSRTSVSIHVTDVSLLD